MALVIRTLHAASKPALLNEEWMVVENTGPGTLTSAGWSLGVARGKGQRPSLLGTMQPGFTLQAGEKIRIVTGTPSRKAEGAPPAPEEGLRNYHLFLKAPVLSRPGVVVVFQLKQHELARAVFAPEAPDGLQAAAAE